MTTYTTETIAEMLSRITPGEWEVIDGDNCGTYGSGPDTHEGFVSYAVVDSEGRTIVDSYNSTVGEIHEDYDEDGHSAWDEAGRRNAAFIAAAPAIVRQLLAERDTARAERDELARWKARTIARCEEVDRLLDSTAAEHTRLRSENESLRTELAAAQAENARLLREYNEEVDEFNAGFQAYKDSLPEDTPHDEPHDVWLCGYAWAAFDDLKRFKSRVLELVRKKAEDAEHLITLASPLATTTVLQAEAELARELEKEIGELK